MSSTSLPTTELLVALDGWESVIAGKPHPDHYPKASMIEALEDHSVRDAVMGIAAIGTIPAISGAVYLDSLPESMATLFGAVPEEENAARFLAVPMSMLDDEGKERAARLDAELERLIDASRARKAAVPYRAISQALGMRAWIAIANGDAIWCRAHAQTALANDLDNNFAVLIRKWANTRESMGL